MWGPLVEVVSAAIWALIVRDRAQYHTIEQRPVDVMILDCVDVFGQSSASLQLPPKKRKWTRTYI